MTDLDLLLQSFHGYLDLEMYDEANDARKWIFGERADPLGSPLRLIQPGVVNVRKKLGDGAFVLTTAQMSEAQNAFQRLPKGTSLTKVVDDWLSRRAPSGGILTTAEVCDEFMVSRKNMQVRPRTLAQYKSELGKIKDEFGDQPIADIDRSGIEDWLSENDWAPRTRKNFLVTLTTLFNFAQDREYCPANPASRIERPILDDNPPGILTVQQAAALLNTALNGIPKKFNPMPQMVPDIAIGLFAGLRRSEICALDWNEIDFDARHIEVKAAKAKTRQRRLVTISDNLVAWLRASEIYCASISPSKNQNTFGGYLSELAQAASITEWPHNALRHSFGSYFYAKTKNENTTAAEMGNSPNVVHRHYRALVRNGDENRYWAIKPSAEVA